MVRTVKLTDNAKDNVKNVGTYRLNKVLDAIRVLGNCCGSQYDWTEDQIETVDKTILDAAEKAVVLAEEL